MPMPIQCATYVSVQYTVTIHQAMPDFNLKHVFDLDGLSHTPRLVYEAEISYKSLDFPGISYNPIASVTAT